MPDAENDAVPAFENDDQNGDDIDELDEGEEPEEDEEDSEGNS